MRRFFIVMLLFYSMYSFPQEKSNISLQYCIKEAVKQYPLSLNKNFIDEKLSYNTKKLNVNYLPSLNLDAAARYQSDITKIDLQLPFPVDIPEPANDQYNLAIDIKQMVYDGGMTRTMKEIETTRSKIEASVLESDIYSLKKNICSLYFSILVIQEKQKLMSLLESYLALKIKTAESASRNGIISKYETDNLKAEKINITQNILELDFNKKALIQSLSSYLKTEISAEYDFEIPELLIADSGFMNSELAMNRVELQIFDNRSILSEKNEKFISGKQLPRIYGFAQTGYGRPGLNMLSDKFDHYYIVGAKLSWDIFDWKRSNYEKQLCLIEMEMNDNSKETFVMNTETLLQTERNNNNKYRMLMRYDEELIKVNEGIVKSAEARFEQGVMSSAELLSAVQALHKANINKKIHEIGLTESEVNMLLISGNLNLLEYEK